MNTKQVHLFLREGSETAGNPTEVRTVSAGLFSIWRGQYDKRKNSHNEILQILTFARSKTLTNF